MKFFLYVTLATAVCLSGCVKNSTNSQAEIDAYNATLAAKQAVIDESLIQNYLAKSSTNAIKDPSGLYYQVVNAGTGTPPTANSTVSVNYTGKFLSDDTVFGTGTNAQISLNSVIQGWTIGLPHVSPGGRIILYIPSALAYGPNGNGSIPPNAVLIFTIDLISVK